MLACVGEVEQEELVLEGGVAGVFDGDSSHLGEGLGGDVDMMMKMEG